MKPREARYWGELHWCIIGDGLLVKFYCGAFIVKHFYITAVQQYVCFLGWQYSRLLLLYCTILRWSRRSAEAGFKGVTWGFVKLLFLTICIVCVSAWKWLLPCMSCKLCRLFRLGKLYIRYYKKEMKKYDETKWRNMMMKNEDICWNEIPVAIGVIPHLKPDSSGV